jgi:hypothetical protein
MTVERKSPLGFFKNLFKKKSGHKVEGVMEIVKDNQERVIKEKKAMKKNRS